MKQLFTILMLLLVTVAYTQWPQPAAQKVFDADQAVMGFELKDDNGQKLDLDTLLYPGNFLEAEGYANYIWGEGEGFFFGTNIYDDQGYGQHFSVYAPYEIYGAFYWFGAAEGTEGNVKFTIWEFVDGEPGNVIAETEIPLADIESSMSLFPNEDEPGALYVDFTDEDGNPVEVTGDYVIGVDITDLDPFGEDINELGNISTLIGEGHPDDLAWIWETTGWIQASEYLGGDHLDIGVIPVLMGEADVDPDTYPVTFYVANQSGQPVVNANITVHPDRSKTESKPVKTIKNTKMLQHEGKPLENAHENGIDLTGNIELYEAPSGKTDPIVMYTNTNGFASFEAADGIYHYMIEKEGHTDASGNFTVAGSSVNLEVDLPEKGLHAVTLNVDMTDAEAEGDVEFDPDIHDVWVTGTFADWSTPGENAAFKLNPTACPVLPEEWVGDAYVMNDFLNYAPPGAYIEALDEDDMPEGMEDAPLIGFSLHEFYRDGTNGLIRNASMMKFWINTNTFDVVIPEQFIGQEVNLGALFGEDDDWVEFELRDPYDVSLNSCAGILEWKSWMSFDGFWWGGFDEFFVSPMFFYDAMDLTNLGDDGNRDNSAEYIYTISIEAEEGDHEYKYFLVENEPTWDFGEWVGEPNREITVSEDMVVNDIWGVMDDDLFAGGTGTESDPWLIETPEHLNNVRHFIGINHADKHFRQIADIDLDVPPYNQDEGWVPIGGEDGWFCGYYDGDGHTVSNLYINRSTNAYQGLFERSVGTIANLGVIDAAVTDHGSRAGILVGLSQVWDNLIGQIINCYTTGSIEADHEDGRIGGLVGWNEGIIMDSWSGADVTSTGMLVGGLAGAANGGTFSNVYATGNVSGDYMVGGLVGTMQSGAQVNNSFVSGNVVNEGSRTGGLVGNIQTNSAISGSYASGNVTGYEDLVGGLVGISFPGVEINNSYAAGTVDAGNGTGAGLVSLMYGTTITNSYAAGPVTGEYTGGLVADKDSLSYVIDSYWDLFSSGLEISDGGQGLPTFEMVQQLNFENWDFNQVWSIEEEESYPWLQWQEEAGGHNYPAFQTFSVTANAAPSAGGTINGAPQYSGTYQDGEEVTLLAEANEGYEFSGWIEGTVLVSNEAEYTFIATGNRALVASFDTESVSVLATANPTEGGSVFGSGIYNTGDPVTLIAEPATGYHFLNWSEDGVIIEDAGAVYGFTAETNRNLVANFGTEDHTISVAVFPEDAGSILGEGTYSHGETVILEAQADEGFQFVSWREGGAVVSTDPNYSFTSERDRMLVAVFTALTYQVSLETIPENNLGGTAYGSGTYTHGTNVNIIANPNLGYAFDHWEEEEMMISEEQIFGFAIYANRDLTAVFTGNTHEITTEVTPAEAGHASGEGNYYEGDIVTMEAESADGYYFLRWMEGDTQISVSNPYYFSANMDRTLTAEFAVQWWPDDKQVKDDEILITAEVTPENTGVVLGQGFYKQGEEVTLTASPNVGINFTAWMEEGDILTDDQDEPIGEVYSFTATENRHLLAVFDGDMHAITVSAEPTDGGSAEVNQEGNFFEGELATVTATANAGYAFEKWTLGVEGPQLSGNPSFSFTVNEDRDLVAHFEQLDEYTLSMEAIPEYAGILTGEGSYVSGTEVLIEAEPNTGYLFGYWIKNGSIYAYQPDTVIVISDEVHVEGFFSLLNYAITAEVAPPEGGHVIGEDDYDHFEEVELQAIPNTGYQFLHWKEDGNVVMDGGEQAGNTYIFAAEDDRNLTAHFELKTYDIEAIAVPEAGGEISGASEYEHFENITLVATPHTGHTFSHWEEDGDTIEEEAMLSFMVTRDRALEAHFASNIYTITSSAGDNGHIDPEGEVEVPYGGDQEFDIMPLDGYVVEYIEVDGQEIDLENDGSWDHENLRYTFYGISQNHAIEAAFKTDETSIADTDLPEVKVYPNPARDILWVEFSNHSDNRVSVKLYNLQGQLVRQVEVNKKGSTQTTLDTKGLMPGVYMLTIESEQVFPKIKVMIRE